MAAADHPLAGRDIGLEARQNDSLNSFAALWEVGSFVLIKQMLRGTDAVSFMYEAVVRREIEEGTLKRLNIRGYDVRHALHFVYLKHSLRRKPAEELYDRMLSQMI